MHLKRSDGWIAILRGDVLTVEVFGRRPVAWGVFSDCTELETLRQSLQHSARLEALASLVGGVAHDFNNLLTVLVGNLSLVAEQFRDKPETFAKLKTARDTATRGSDLIRQLLGFAGAQEVETSAVDPSQVIGDVVPLLSRALGKRIQLETELEPGTGSIDANVAQLESVIVNLAVNARDAIAGRGTVTISSSRHDLDERGARGRGLEPGEYVRIRVADDGSGIPGEMLESVFEPFVSTKRDRGGTGLGLSMVRSFARGAGGSAAIRSRPGEGTAVTLWLPVSEEPADTGSAQTRALAALPTGTERVLVIAADTGLGTTVRQILEAVGYAVTVCSDPGEVDAAAAPHAFELLIVDGLRAGSPDGSDLVARLRDGDAGLKTICLLESKDDADSTSAAPAAVLEKPFSLPDLATLVRETLDG